MRPPHEEPRAAGAARGSEEQTTESNQSVAASFCGTAIAAEINREHELACLRAGEAVEHGCRAGALLLKVKAGLQHGGFLPWVVANIQVTPRQAQRYMAAALGKPLPVRSIKSDTRVANEPLKSSVELLLDKMKPAVPTDHWVHHVAELGLCATQGARLFAGKDDVWIEPADTDGWFYAVKIVDGCQLFEHFGRPLSLAGVAIALDMLGAQLEPRASLHAPFDLGRTFTVPDADATRYRNAVDMGLMAGDGARSGEAAAA